MKKATITTLGLSLCALAYYATSQEETPAPAAPAETAAPTETAAPAETAAPYVPSEEEMRLVISYFMGYQTGQQIAGDGAGPISIDDFDKDVFFRALADGMRNRVDPEIEKKDIRANIMAFAAKLEARQKAAGEKNLAASKAYAEQNGKKEGVTTTPSGLQYSVITPAEGHVYNEETDGYGAIASVTYEGRLLDGTVFDKSEEPISFPISGVIPGFSEALKLMPVGSEWEVFIPSELGYGEQGPGILGSNAALIFKMKLHGIEAKPGPKPGSPSNPVELDPELLKQLEAQGLQPVNM